MASSSAPIQMGRTIITTSDGRVIDRQVVHLSGFPAGNVKDAVSAMPELGSPDPDGLGAPLYSRGVISMIDGTSAYGQLTYDNRGGGGWFVGALKKGSRTLPMVEEDLIIRQYFNAGDIQVLRERKVKRPMRIRVETRIVRDANGVGPIQNLIDSQLNYGWFKDGLNYVFVDGCVYDSGNTNEYRVEYFFKITAGVAADPLGPFAVNAPELEPNYQYKEVVDQTTGRVTAIQAVPMWREGVEVLRLPGL